MLKYLILVLIMTLGCAKVFAGPLQAYGCAADETHWAVIQPDDSFNTVIFAISGTAVGTAFANTQASTPGHVVYTQMTDEHGNPIPPSTLQKIEVDLQGDAVVRVTVYKIGQQPLVLSRCAVDDPSK